MPFGREIQWLFYRTDQNPCKNQSFVIKQNAAAIFLPAFTKSLALHLPMSKIEGDFSASLPQWIVSHFSTNAKASVKRDSGRSELSMSSFSLFEAERFGSLLLTEECICSRIRRVLRGFAEKRCPLRASGDVLVAGECGDRLPLGFVGRFRIFSWFPLSPYPTDTKGSIVFDLRWNEFTHTKRGG